MLNENNRKTKTTLQNFSDVVLPHSNPALLGNDTSPSGLTDFSRDPHLSGITTTSFSFSQNVQSRTRFSVRLAASVFSERASKFAQGVSARLQVAFKSFFLFRFNILRLLPRASIPLLITLTGCSHAQIKTYDVQADFKKAAPISEVGASSILRPEISSKMVSIGSESDKTLTTRLSKRPRESNLKQPLRFAFTAVPIDLILRRISEYTDLEFFADEELISQSSVTLDLTVSSSEEIYALLDMVGSMLGVDVKWSGNKAVFNRSEGASTKPIDGYLITPILLSSDTTSIIFARYDVNCTIVTTLTLCLGENDKLVSAQSFIRAIDNARDLVSYRLVTTPTNLSLVASTLGLNDRVVLQPLDDDQWLMVSNDARHFDLLLTVSENIQSAACQSFIFTPLHVDVEELFSVVPESGSACAQSRALSDKILLSGNADQISKTRALLTQLDISKPIARMFVLVASAVDSKSFGLEVDGFNGRIPSDNVLSAVQLSAAITKASGWRSLEIVTDGQSSSNVSQSDRVQGSLLVTDGGSQVSGIEDRTVGLTFDINGVITAVGFRGRIGFTDSALDGEITRTSNCEAYVTLQMHQLTRVCSYSAQGQSARAGLLNASKSDNSDDLEVYIAILSHEVAALETLRKLIK